MTIRTLRALLLCLALAGVAACNTVQGAGEDAGNAVDRVKDVVD